MKTQIALVGIGALLLATNVFADLPAASDKKGVTYAADIKPILDKSCVKCHSGDKPKAKLDLSSLENISKTKGKLIVAGKSAESQLVLAIGHLDKAQDKWMPPLHNKANIGPLTPEEIGLIRAWIDQGTN